MQNDIQGSKIAISHIVKKYGDVVAVNDVSLNIEAGTFLTLLGPSGSGKTTILKMIAGFESLTSGEVYINDEPVSKKPSYKRNVGMVFQNYALFPHKTVAQNVAFPLRMRKMSKDVIREKTKEALELVKLLNFEKRYPRQLSGGQQQRVALARSLVYGPSVLLMDEPLGALDKKLREHMQLELKRIKEQLKITIIYVTHDQSEALNMSDMIAVLNDGQIEQVGSPLTLYEHPESYFVADFIGESNFIDGVVTGFSGDLSIIQTNIGCDLKVPRDDIHLQGASVKMIIHPEKIEIVDSPREEGNTITGRVSEVVYLGELTKYYIQIENGETIYMKYHNRAGISQLHVNDNVFIHWAFDDCKLTS
jgi:putative spermidine/putrescine transport system ATP-binding protein